MLTCSGAATWTFGEKRDRTGSAARRGGGLKASPACCVDTLRHELRAIGAFSAGAIGPGRGRTAWTRVATRALKAVARGALRATPRLAVTEDREARDIFSGLQLDCGEWRRGPGADISGTSDLTVTGAKSGMKMKMSIYCHVWR
jgi:hypothetical protein